MDKKTAALAERIKANSHVRRLAKPKKKKVIKIFEKMPKDSHLMADGKTVMSGKKHTKDSKVIGKIKKKKK